jgi:hypothetical protein
MKTPGRQKAQSRFPEAAPAFRGTEAGALVLDLEITFLTFAFCSLYYSAVEETGNRRCRLHCHLGSHESAAACSSP